MAQSKRNPYRPGVGLQPTYLAGREGDIEKYVQILNGAPDIPANIRITGLRGIGKTVLLRELQATAESNSWAAIGVELEPRHCTESAFTKMLSSKADALKSDLSIAKRVKDVVRGASDVVRQAASVTFEEFTWSLAGDIDAHAKDIAELLLDATRAATNKGRVGLALLFDEAQILVDSKKPTGDHPLSALIAAVSLLQKHGIPVSLTLCGLPTLTVNLLRARTYSERMFRGISVGSLSEDAARDALTRPLEGTSVSATSELVDRVIADVDGYPYFIQLWGAELWDTTIQAGLDKFTIETLTVIEQRIQDRLDEDFYSPRVESLTPAEQDALLTSAHCPYPPLRVSDLNSASPKSPENINVLLGRLVGANVLYRPRKGEYRYTAPRFREYLLRRIESEIDKE